MIFFDREDAAKEREAFSKYTSLLSLPCAPCTPAEPDTVQFTCPWFLFCARSLQHSHDGAALGLVLAEGGGEELCLAGQMEESLRETADRAGFIGRLEFVHAGQSCGTKNTVYALL